MSTSTRATGHKRLRIRGGRLPAKVLHSLVSDLCAGRVAVFPTETVYGIGTSAFATEGIRRIYRLKGRNWRKPLAVLVPTLEAAAPLVEEIPKEAFKMARRFCPGPLTLVFKASALGRLIVGGTPTIGVRIPDHPVALAILRAIHLPLATTSVNKSGEEPATSGAECAKGIGKSADWLLDAGRCPLKVPSSVVDFSHYPFTVIREGGIRRKELEKALLV